MARYFSEAHLTLSRSMFLLGMPFYVIFVQIPQRFQVVNFTSAERAGVLLLPATLTTPIGSMVAGLAAKKLPLEYVLIFSTCLICVGVGLLGSLPTYSTLFAGIYGYEIVSGIALGLATPAYYMFVASSIPEKEISVGTGALNMVRTLGGCVAIAICSAVHREYITHRLSGFLSPSQTSSLLKSSGYVAQLPMEARDRVGKIFGSSYNRQFQVMLAFSGLNVIVSIVLVLVRKKMGLFGVIPTAKEENEFKKGTETKAANAEAKEAQRDIDDTQTKQPSISGYDIQSSSGPQPK